MKLSEVKGALTLEQLERMHGQRVLVPDTELTFGGFGEVDVTNKIVENLIASETSFALGLEDMSLPDDCLLRDWEFLDYGKTWIAVADPFGVLEVENETNI